MSVQTKPVNLEKYKPAKILLRRYTMFIKLQIWKTFDSTPRVRKFTSLQLGSQHDFSKDVRLFLLCVHLRDGSWIPSASAQESRVKGAAAVMRQVKTAASLMRLRVEVQERRKRGQREERRTSASSSDAIFHHRIDYPIYQGQGCIRSITWSHHVSQTPTGGGGGGEPLSKLIIWHTTACSAVQDKTPNKQSTTMSNN